MSPTRYLAPDPRRSLQVRGPPGVESVEMGQVAGLGKAWKAPGESMDTEPPTFEEFFEDQKERLLRILSVITGSRAEAEDLAQEAFTRVFERWKTVAAMISGIWSSKTWRAGGRLASPIPSSHRST
jgi:hypothetical protein